jgi:hypothetical protein
MRPPAGGASSIIDPVKLGSIVEAADLSWNGTKFAAQH